MFPSFYNAPTLEKKRNYPPPNYLPPQTTTQPSTQTGPSFYQPPVEQIQPTLPTLQRTSKKHQLGGEEGGTTAEPQQTETTTTQQPRKIRDPNPNLPQFYNPPAPAPAPAPPPAPAPAPAPTPHITEIKEPKKVAEPKKEEETTKKEETFYQSIMGFLSNKYTANPIDDPFGREEDKPSKLVDDMNIISKKDFERIKRKHSDKITHNHNIRGKKLTQEEDDYPIHHLAVCPIIDPNIALKLFYHAAKTYQTTTFIEPTTKIGVLIEDSDIGTIVAIRGTKELTNWTTNLNSRNLLSAESISLASLFDFITEEQNLFVHKGFGLAIQKLYPLIKDRLGENTDISYTGHSLGSIVCIFAYLYLIEKGVYPRYLYTFGSPRMFINYDKYPISRFNNRLDCIRIFNHYDIISYLPTRDSLIQSIGMGGLIGGTFGYAIGSNFHRGHQALATGIGGVLGTAIGNQIGNYIHIGTGVMLFSEKGASINAEYSPFHEPIKAKKLPNHKNYAIIPKGLDQYRDIFDLRGTLSNWLLGGFMYGTFKEYLESSLVNYNYPHIKKYRELTENIASWTSNEFSKRLKGFLTDTAINNIILTKTPRAKSTLDSLRYQRQSLINYGWNSLRRVAKMKIASLPEVDKLESGLIDYSAVDAFVDIDTMGISKYDFFTYTKFDLIENGITEEYVAVLDDPYFRNKFKEVMKDYIVGINSEWLDIDPFEVEDSVSYRANKSKRNQLLFEIFSKQENRVNYWTTAIGFMWGVLGASSKANLFYETVLMETEGHFGKSYERNLKEMGGEEILIDKHTNHKIFANYYNDVLDAKNTKTTNREGEKTTIQEPNTTDGYKEKEDDWGEEDEILYDPLFTDKSKEKVSRRRRSNYDSNRRRRSVNIKEKEKEVEEIELTHISNGYYYSNDKSLYKSYVKDSNIKFKNTAVRILGLYPYKKSDEIRNKIVLI